MIQQMDILFKIKNGKEIVLESINDLLVFFILHYNMHRHDLTTGAMDIDIFFLSIIQKYKKWNIKWHKCNSEMVKGITEHISIAWENEFNWGLPNVICKCLLLTSYKKKSE